MIRSFNKYLLKYKLKRYILKSGYKWGLLQSANYYGMQTRVYIDTVARLLWFNMSDRWLATVRSVWIATNVALKAAVYNHCKALHASYNN